ncbi:clathrin light chain [Lipomyces japonicus]|uniref:clathrin light chain n=1 Tax=Lipomyces japonicus TaxID=56871 RepID=UPI0034CFAAB9
MSHFPSLEEIDNGQTEVIENGADAIDFNIPEDEDDFLAREKAILGTDVDAIVDSGDLLNGDSAVHDAFPSAQLQSLSPQQQNQQFQSTTSAPAQHYEEKQEELVEEEPDVVKEWRERRELAIQRRDEQSEAKKNQTRQEAKNAIDDFYENYNNKKEQATTQTRTEEKEFIENRENTVAGGTSWERIVKLVDLSEKNARTSSVDKTRFRELLLSLKDDPNAPGAKGY